MSQTLLDDPAVAQARLLRGFVATLAWKLGGVGVIDFLLLRVLGPDLVNRHQDLALIAALACVVLALAATLWLAFQLWFDIRRFRAARRAIARAPTLKVESR
jgi:hypothetical protein